MKVNTENNRNKIKVFIIKVPQCSFPLPNQNKDLTTEGRFNPMPSLALGYLGGFLRKYGGDYLDITLQDINVDAYIDSPNGEVENSSLLDRVDLEIRKADYDVIGISCAFVNNHRWVKLAVECAKRYYPDKPIIIGGGYPTLFPETAMRETGASYGVVGEGEVVLLKIVNNIFSVENLQFDGLFPGSGEYLYWKSGELKRAYSSSLISDIDLIPFPAWDLLNVHGFLSKHTIKSLYCLTSRGCPFKCIYCSTFMAWGRSIRNRSAENVLAEIDWTYKHFGLRHLHFVDDNMIMDRERINNILQCIIDRDYNGFSWSASAFAIKTLKEDTVDLMVKSKMTRITLPIEVGTPEMQKKVKKDLDLKKAEEVYKWFDRYEIPIRITVMIGFPMETMEEINATIDFVKRLRPHEAHVNIVTPWPGTELYDYAVKNNKLDSEISLDDLDHHTDVGFVNVEWSYAELKKIRGDMNLFFNFLCNRDLLSPKNHKRLLKKWQSFEFGLPKHAVLFIGLGYLTRLMGDKSESDEYYEKAVDLFRMQTVRDTYIDCLEWDDVPAIQNFKSIMGSTLSQALN